MDYTNFTAAIEIGLNLVNQKFCIPTDSTSVRRRILEILNHESIYPRQTFSFTHDNEFPQTNSFEIIDKINSGILSIESTLTITSSTNYVKEIEKSRVSKNPPATIGDYRIAPSRLKAKNQIFFSPDDPYALELIISGDMGNEKPGINNKLIQLRYSVDEPKLKQAKLYFHWEDPEEHTGPKNLVLLYFNEYLKKQELNNKQFRQEVKEETYVVPYIDAALQAYIKSIK